MMKMKPEEMLEQCMKEKGEYIAAVQYGVRSSNVRSLFVFEAWEKFFKHSLNYEHPIQVGGEWSIIFAKKEILKKDSEYKKEFLSQARHLIGGFHTFIPI